MKKVCIEIFITVFLISGSLWPVSAQQSFSISPAVINLTLRPNQTIKKSIIISNKSPNAQTMTAKIRTAGSSQRTYSQAIGWISVSPNSFTIPPNRSIPVTIFLKVPPAPVETKEKVLVIFQTSGFSVNTGIGSLLILTVQPYSNKVLGISNKPFFQQIFSFLGP